MIRVPPLSPFHLNKYNYQFTSISPLLNLTQPSLYAVEILSLPWLTGLIGVPSLCCDFHHRLRNIYLPVKNVHISMGETLEFLTMTRPQSGRSPTLKVMITGNKDPSITKR